MEKFTKYYKIKVIYTYIHKNFFNVNFYFYFNQYIIHVLLSLSFNPSMLSKGSL